MKKLLITFIIALLVPTSVLAEPTESDLNNAQNQITQYQSEQSQAQAKLDDLNAQIQKIDTEATELMLQQEQVQAKIDSKQVEIENTKKELEKAIAQLKQSEDQFNKYARNVYKSGQDDTLQILFSSKNFADLIDKVETAKLVGKFNQNLIEEFKSNKKLVEEKSEELNKEQNSLFELKSQLEQSINSLNEAKNNVAALVAQQEELKKSIDDKLQVSQQEYDGILSYLNEEKRKAEEAKAAQEAQAAQAAQAAQEAQANQQTQPAQTTPAAPTNQTSNSNNSNSNSGGSTSPSAGAYDVVNYALSFQGLPYVWGGTTPAGFDCSGFVQYVYKHFGYNVSRSTYTQISDGIEVSNLQPGDLVFFGDYNAPHHVGMYIGNGCYVHAPQTGDVIKISKLGGYCRARRIIH